MDIFFGFQAILIGLMGWAATNVLILSASKYTTSQKRALVVGAWGVWMFPSFNLLVLKGVLSGDIAVQYCGGLTILLTVLVFISGLRWRTRP